MSTFLHESFTWVKIKGDLYQADVSENENIKLITKKVRDINDRVLQICKLIAKS